MHAPSVARPHPHPHHPVYFEEFFELGLEETVSPFLTPESRKWGKHISLKASLFAAFLLLIAFVFSFYPTLIPLNYFFLILVYFLTGIPSLIASLEDLLALDINIDVLMTLAAFSSVLIGSGMEGGLLLVLFSLSGAMEEAVTEKAKSSISSISKLSPTRATVVEDDGLHIEKALSDVNVGTTILVKSGEVVPLDGKVIKGISSVNLVHLTGENLPLRKTIDDEVQAGARNMEGALLLKVTHTSSDSTLARIINLITQAQEARPRLQRWFDRLSRGYALTIISLATLFALSFPFLLNLPFLGVDGALYRSLAFLIAASPCALIIAIPIAYLSAISICARRGVLLKGGITLDALASCKAVAFDKTGTLTTGHLTCLGIEPLTPLKKEEEEQILSSALALEQNAVHPIARSIVAYAQEKGVVSAEITNFKSVPGYGLQGEVASRELFIGHPDFVFPKLSSSHRQLLQEKIATCRENGELIAVMTYGETPLLFRFQDTVRPYARETIQALREREWLTVMLTGDHEETARRVAREVGLDEYHANLKPEDKLDYVADLTNEKGLAMLGDGVNDAPALARSTVGISMGKMGSAAAVDASDVVFLNDNLELLDWLVGKAKQTQTIVKQNLSVASCAILIATIPALAGYIPLWLAVVLHEGGTVLVGLNALRLLRK